MLPAIGYGLPIGGGVTSSKEAPFSQDQLLGGSLLCTARGQHSWHLREGCLVLAMRHSIYSEHLLYSQIPCIQILSSLPLETEPQEFRLASFQGKLTRGRLEGGPQLLHCICSQGQTDTHHFSVYCPPILSLSALLKVKVAYFVGQPRPSTLRDLNPWSPCPSWSVTATFDLQNWIEEYQEAL